MACKGGFEFPRPRRGRRDVGGKEGCSCSVIRQASSVISGPETVPTAAGKVIAAVLEAASAQQDLDGG